MDVVTVLFLGIYMFLCINSNMALYISLCLFCVWLFVATMNSLYAFEKACMRKDMLLVYGYACIIFFVGLISLNVFYNIKQMISALLTFSPCLIMGYYRNWDEERIEVVSRYLLFVWVAISLYSIGVGIKYPGIGRFITSGDRYSGQALLIGGVNIATGALLVGLYMLYEVKNGKNKKNRILYIIAYIVQLAAIIFAGSTICLLCFLIGTFVVLMPHKKKWVYLSCTVVVFGMVSMLILHGQIGEFIIRISQKLDDVTYSARFSSLGNVIAYGMKTDNRYLFERIERPLLSMNTFIANPLLGVSYKYGNYYPLQYEYGVGCHGEWADALAKYGVFGLLYIAIWGRVLKNFYKEEKKVPVWFLMWLVLGCVNPCVTVIATTIIYIIVPGLEDISKNKECE